jgi:hypothetical protein
MNKELENQTRFLKLHMTYSYNMQKEIQILIYVLAL